MKYYIFEYRNENYEPKIVGIEANGKKDACKKAKTKIGKKCYLVEHSIKSTDCALKSGMKISKTMGE